MKPEYPYYYIIPYNWVIFKWNIIRHNTSNTTCYMVCHTVLALFYLRHYIILYVSIIIIEIYNYVLIIILGQIVLLLC